MPQKNWRQLSRQLEVSQTWIFFQSPSPDICCCYRHCYPFLLLLLLFWTKLLVLGPSVVAESDKDVNDEWFNFHKFAFHISTHFVMLQQCQALNFVNPCCFCRHLVHCQWNFSSYQHFPDIVVLSLHHEEHKCFYYCLRLSLPCLSVPWLYTERWLFFQLGSSSF